MSLLFECKKEECTRTREKWIGGGGAASKLLLCQVGALLHSRSSIYGSRRIIVTLSGYSSDELP